MPSPRFRRSAFAASTDEGLLWLLRISHADLPAEFRFVNDRDGLTSRGRVYEAYPFAVVMPTRREDQTGMLKLSIDNVDRRIMLAARGLTSPADVEVEAVLIGTKDVVEMGPFVGELARTPYDGGEVTAEMSIVPDADQRFPNPIFTPRTNPGLTP